MGKLFWSDTLVDWTFSEAPAADEPPWVDERPASRRGLAARPVATDQRLRLTWLLPGVLALLALATTAAIPRFQAWRVRRAVEDLVAQQEQARLTGDWPGVRATFQDPAGDWAIAQTEHLRTNWQTAAFGLPAAHLAGRAGKIREYQVLSPRLVRVDVVRTFVQANGAPVQFALAQYYQFGSGAWRQVPPPRTPAGDPQALHGARVDVHHNPTDAALAAIVAGDLETLLARACADWDCPADLRVAVVFGRPNPASEANAAPADALPGSLTYRMLAAGQPRLPGLVVNLPTREWAGYPADGPALAAIQRAVAVQVLANIGERLSGGVPVVSGPIRPLRYALIVRELARLGVEPASLLALDRAQFQAEPGQIWSASDGAAWQALPGALATVDGLLDGRSLTDEQHLLQRLKLSPDIISWVADGLGLTPEQARACLAQLWQD